MRKLRTFGCVWAKAALMWVGEGITTADGLGGRVALKEHHRTSSRAGWAEGGPESSEEGQLSPWEMELPSPM